MAERRNLMRRNRPGPGRSPGLIGRNAERPNEGAVFRFRSWPKLCSRVIWEPEGWERVVVLVCESAVPGQVPRKVGYCRVHTWHTNT